MITHNTKVSKFDIGDVVYFHTDPDQRPYLINSYNINSNGFTVSVSNHEEERWVQEFELTTDKIYKFGDHLENYNG